MYWQDAEDKATCCANILGMVNIAKELNTFVRLELPDINEPIDPRALNLELEKYVKQILKRYCLWVEGMDISLSDISSTPGFEGSVEIYYGEELIAVGDFEEAYIPHDELDEEKYDEELSILPDETGELQFLRIEMLPGEVEKLLHLSISKLSPEEKIHFLEKVI